MPSFFFFYLKNEGKYSEIYTCIYVFKRAKNIRKIYY